MPREKLCKKRLSVADIQKFAEACEEDYYVRIPPFRAVLCLRRGDLVSLARLHPRLQFEMFVDDLPVYGYIGEHEHEDMILGHTEKSRHYLYTHLHFWLTYNGDRIISANVTTDPLHRLDITDEGGEPLDVEFTYSVEWSPTTDSYENRMSRCGSVSKEDGIVVGRGKRCNIGFDDARLRSGCTGCHFRSSFRKSDSICVLLVSAFIP